MNPITRRAYWEHVLTRSFLASFRRGLGLGIAIIVTVLIAIYQQVHHVSIEHDGLLAFLKPYLTELLLWFLFQVSEACWRLHQETEIRNAYKRLKELSLHGQKLLNSIPSQDAKGEDFCRVWSEQKRQWEEVTGNLLAQHWGTDSQQSFFSITGLDLNQAVARVHQNVVPDYLYLNRYLLNLEHLRQVLNSQKSG